MHSITVFALTSVLMCKITHTLYFYQERILYAPDKIGGGQGMNNKQDDYL